MKKPKPPKSVESLTHDDAKRSNIPTAEYQSVVDEQTKSPIRVAYERRNRDLDPQLVWRGKDEQDWSDLVVPAPPLYIQEKVHPKVLIDDLRRETERLRAEQDGGGEEQLDLFGDFNGLPSEEAKTEFYQHEQNWANRMILGDSLRVMASLAEREGLRGKVQCIYFDPPYGIKFNSNFQWSTTSRDVKDGNTAHITREPEQVKAFRDTWRDGIHSYLTYLRDRLTVARDLLTESGSIFVQIGDETQTSNSNFKLPPQKFSSARIRHRPTRRRCSDQATDVVARARLLPASEGGRDSFVCTGYRPNIRSCGLYTDGSFNPPPPEALHLTRRVL
jgi:adenine-specific DNA-methyltransferase